MNMPRDTLLTHIAVRGKSSPYAGKNRSTEQSLNPENKLGADRFPIRARDCTFPPKDPCLAFAGIGSASPRRPIQPIAKVARDQEYVGKVFSLPWQVVVFRWR